MASLRLPASKKSIRSSAPRNRTGCQTCRKRRVKCDETKPACGKCTQAGWKCDGYGAHTSSKSSTSDDNQATRASPRPNLSITSYAIPFRVPGSQKDRRLLHYFCVQGSSDIAGFLSSDFWSRIVLRESHRDHIVRQALISLSALHLDYVTMDGTRDEIVGVDALAQYGKALRVLRRRLASPSKETIRVALICSIIFYCCESTLGNSDAAVQHLNGGLKVLPSYSCEQVWDDAGELEMLSSIFERLDLQATLFNDERLPVLTLASERSIEMHGGGMPSEGEFSRLEDAQRALVKLQNRLFHFLINNVKLKDLVKESIPPNVVREKCLLMQQYSQWSQRFSDFTKGAEHDTQMLHGIKTLLVQFRVSHMLLASNLPADGDIFGASPNESAAAVLKLAESVLWHTSERNASAETAKNPRRNFSSETGIVAPLFLLAMKCSDESVSSRAADLLAVSERREGLYDAQAMARIVNALRASKLRGLGGNTEHSVENAECVALEDWLLDGNDDAKGGMDMLANYI